MSENTASDSDWITYAPRPRLALLALPGLFCIVLFALILMVEVHVLPAGAWLLGASVILMLGSLVSAVLLVRQMQRDRVAVQVSDDSFRARQGAASPVSIAWRDVRRVQSGDHSLIFDVLDDGRPRQMIVSAPAPSFPSDELCRAIGARLDASRGYASSLCDATGEPTETAIEHGGCSNPLGCGSAGACAVQALRSGAAPAGDAVSGVGTNPA